MRVPLLVIFLVHTASAETLVLPIGKVRDVPAGAVSSIHVGSKSILNVVDGGKKVSLIPKKPGETHVRIGKTDYLVEVVDPSVESFYDELVPVIKRMQGLKIGFRNGRLKITGQLLRFED